VELAEEWIAPEQVRWQNGRALAPSVDVDLEEVIERMSKSRGNVVNPDDVENMRFNTAISKLMVFTRDIARDAPLPRDAADAFVRLLSPFAPHLAEELWRHLGHTTSVALAGWPEADAAQLARETLTLVVQVNGKRRAEIVVPADADEAAVRSLALASERVRHHLGNRPPRKVIVVPGRLVNVVG